MKPSTTQLRASVYGIRRLPELPEGVEIGESPTFCSISDIKQRLDRLDPSGDEYRQPLLELLSHRDLEVHVHGLQGSDLRGFVELLDRVSNVDIHLHQR